MTRTINKEAYAELLVKYQPTVIETESENEAALALAEELEHRERTPEEDAFLDLLVTLIEKFEDEHYQLGVVLGLVSASANLRYKDPNKLLESVLSLFFTSQVPLPT
jgi:hypothetical protein